MPPRKKWYLPEPTYTPPPEPPAPEPEPVVEAPAVAAPKARKKRITKPKPAPTQIEAPALESIQVEPEPKKRRRRPRVVAVDGPDPIDQHVGSRVRLRRTLMGVSQQALGASIGLTFQQVQKYERGANRISASMLYKISTVLDVPVSFFFDDMPDSTQPGLGNLDERLFSREALELMRHYLALPDDTRRAYYEAIRATAKSTSTDPDQDAG